MTYLYFMKESTEIHAPTTGVYVILLLGIESNSSNLGLVSIYLYIGCYGHVKISGQCYITIRKQNQRCLGGMYSSFYPLDPTYFFFKYAIFPPTSKYSPKFQHYIEIHVCMWISALIKTQLFLLDVKDHLMGFNMVYIGCL